MLRLIDCWDLTPSHADAKVRTKYTYDELLRGQKKDSTIPSPSESSTAILSTKKVLVPYSVQKNSAKGLVEES